MANRYSKSNFTVKEEQTENNVSEYRARRNRVTKIGKALAVLVALAMVVTTVLWALMGSV